MSSPETNQTAVRTFSAFVAMLEDGALHDELSDALRDLNAAMNNHVLKYGGKAKGKLALNVELTLADGVFEITADFKASEPRPKRGRSIAWSTPSNHFSPENPRQMNLFGPREVHTPAEVRAV